MPAETGQPGTDAGESCRALSQIARECKIFLVGGAFFRTRPTWLAIVLDTVFFSAGSIPEKNGDKYYNTSMSFGPDGALLGIFRKVRTLHCLYMFQVCVFYT